MTLRTLERLRQNVKLSRDLAGAALARTSDPSVAQAAADSKLHAEKALTILDAEIEEKRSRFPSRNQAVAR